MGAGRRALWAARTVAYHAAYNALTRAAPRVSSAIQRATRDTGRGDGRDGAAGAAYFEAVASDYDVIARASGACDAGIFRGKRVLELGPGDTRAVALIARLEGANAWEGFDAFDIQSRDARYLDAIYAPILAERKQARSALNVLDTCIMHTKTESLLRGGPRFDLVVSRAVLEHVRDLGALFGALSRITTDDAVLIHKVDLRAHGIEHEHPLDFLRFSDRTWNAMSSHVDLPNRERASRYFDLGFHTAWAATTHTVDAVTARALRSRLAPRFRAMTDADLLTLGLWLVQVGPRHPLAKTTRAPLAPAPRDRLSRH